MFTEHGDLRFVERGRLPIDRGRLMGQLQRPTGLLVPVRSIESDKLNPFFPTGITYLQETDRYVIADYENRWISLYELNGKFVSRFGMGKLLGKNNYT